MKLKVISQKSPNPGVRLRVCCSEWVCPMPFQLRYTLKTLKFEQPIGLYPAGTAIVGAQENRIIGTWDVGTGKLIQTLELHGDPKQIQISQTGQTAIVRYGKIGSLFYVVVICSCD